MLKHKFGFRGLSFVFIILIYTGTLIFAPDTVSKNSRLKQVGSTLSEYHSSDNRINLSSNLLPSRLTNILRITPKSKYSYQLLIDGLILGIKNMGWVDDSGTEIYFGNEFEKWDMTSINHNHYKIKFNGISLTTDPALADWLGSVSDAVIVRKKIEVVVLDANGLEKARWNISSAWPVKYDPPDFSAKRNEVVIESIEVQHEGIQRVDDDD